MRACLVGEGMVELAGGPGGWRVGYGGDTLNTAIHLARLGWDVAYVTALGADPLSADLRDAWIAEGLEGDSLLVDPDRNVGLYAIRTDAAGERSFAYWRDRSAARTMFALPAMAGTLQRAERADLVAYSLITLAILPPEGREALWDFCDRARSRGAKIAFDGNFRPRLWDSADEAAAARDRALQVCDIGLPTLDDERLLSGAGSADSVADRWGGAGAREVVVKLGEVGCRVHDGSIAPPPQVLRPVDTSGAGDAFNAGYLDARLAGASPQASAMAGHRLAGWVIGRSGAIPPRDAAAPYGPPM